MTEEHDALRQEAARYGLTNLTEHHLEQLRHAKEAATRFVHSVPRDLPISLEPAHTFRASKEA